MLDHMRLTPEEEAAYSLDYGVSRDGLKPEVQAEYDRLLAERRARPRAKPHIDQSQSRNVRLQGIDKAERVAAWILTSLVALAFVTWSVVMGVNTRHSFPMLRADLNQVRLPSGYHLVTVNQSRNCSGCWLIETWTRPGNSERIASATCSDVYHAMAAAYPPQEYGSLDGNPLQDMPAGTTCDYDTLKLGPGFTKVSIEAFARTDERRSDGGVVIQLIASIVGTDGCYDVASQKPDC